jgi:hypothetical protein
MTDNPPRVRTDLIVHGSHQGPDRFVLEDPRTGRAFTFKAPELTVMNLCNGQVSTQAIAEAASRELGLTVPVASVATFLARLDNLGLLDRDVAVPSDSQSTLLPGGFIELRLERWSRSLRLAARVLFSSQALWLAPTLLVALATKGRSQRSVHIYEEDAKSFLGPRRILATLILVYLGLPISGLVHELGHVLAALRFTGQVNTIRISPRRLRAVTHIPPSTVWRLQNPSQRLAIALAGVYLELVLLAATLFLWRRPWLPPVLRQACFGMTIPLVGGPLVNLLPALPQLPSRRTDGYFALSYLMGIPNLAARSQEYIAWTRLHNRRPSPPNWFSEFAPRQQRAFVTYAFLAPWLSLLILVSGYCALGRYLLLLLPPSAVIAPMTVLGAWLAGPYWPLAIQLAKDFGWSHCEQFSTSGGRGLTSP